MAEDDDAIGPDGTVRLRCYLPLRDSLWFTAACRGCHRLAPIGVSAAVKLMGTPEATTGALRRHLRCARCGSRDVWLQVSADPRPPEARERDGPLPETRARLR